VEGFVEREPGVLSERGPVYVAGEMQGLKVLLRQIVRLIVQRKKEGPAE
jgi:hypothetical protein